MIYFCWASLEHTIYVIGGGVGFTHCTSKFVDAPTKEQACAAYRVFLEVRSIRVRRMTGSVAVYQDRKRYVFPEQILAARA
jgi:hypothetical protein